MITLIKPTREEMRAMGYAADAEPVALSDRAFAAFCAWVNIPADQMPKMTRFKPRETAEAWERVATRLDYSRACQSCGAPLSNDCPSCKHAWEN